MQNVTPFNARECKITPETSRTGAQKSCYSLTSAAFLGPNGTNKQILWILEDTLVISLSLPLSPCPCNISSKISTNSMRRKLTHSLSFPQVSWCGRATVDANKDGRHVEASRLWHGGGWCHLPCHRSFGGRPRSLRCYCSNLFFGFVFFN